MPEPRPASRLDDDPRDSEKLAYAAGRRDAEVDQHLRRLQADVDGHERRLNAINGSIDRGARETAALRGTVDGLHGKVDQIVTTLDTNAAVEAERNKLLKQANEKQISTRTFLVGIAGVCAVLIVGFVTVYVMLQTAGVPHR